MYVLKFEDLNKSDIGIAGGKGANLGELTQAGIPVPPGFVVTAETYEKFMEDSGINGKVMDILDKIDINDTKELQMASEEIKAIITSTPVPDDMSTLILEAYNQLCQKVGEDDTDVAIRSSATAEDLPEASLQVNRKLTCMFLEMMKLWNMLGNVGLLYLKQEQFSIGRKITLNILKYS